MNWVLNWCGRSVEAARMPVATILEHHYRVIKQAADVGAGAPVLVRL